MTNQVNTLTNQDVMLDLYKIHAYIPYDAAGNTLTPFGNFCEGYQAATQASESEINSLKERVKELEADLELLKPHPKCDMGCMLSCNTEGNAIRELQADNNQLRKELETTLTSLQERKI